MIITVTFNPCVDRTLEIERLEVGRVNRVKSSLTHAGGKGLNVSRVLRSFGTPNLACALTGGRQGDFIRESLTAEGIDFQLTQADGDTRTNCKVYDVSTGEMTEINERGAPLCADTLDKFIDSIAAKLPEASLLVLSGSLPEGVDDGIYARLIDLAREQGVRTVLDADGERLSLGIEHVPLAIKPNIYELEQLTGRSLDSDGDILAAARALVGRGIELVAVSMGASGAMFVNGGEAWRTYPFPIEVKSAVGSGDSMVAACIFALVNSFDMPGIARFSTAAGTVTASKPGTQLCTFNEVLEKAALVKAEQLI